MQLSQFQLVVGEMTQAEATKAMMRLFGFQAVESRMAIQTLLSKSKPALLPGAGDER
ncbi:MAG: hypothetical protein IPK83_13055 [Planctomycetes bacterium]|nr:hypothetical protein [Planctomycetota bacterium]